VQCHGLTEEIVVADPGVRSTPNSISYTWSEAECVEIRTKDASV